MLMSLPEHAAKRCRLDLVYLVIPLHCTIRPERGNELRRCILAPGLLSQLAEFSFGVLQIGSIKDVALPQSADRLIQLCDHVLRINRNTKLERGRGRPVVPNDTRSP